MNKGTLLPDSKYSVFKIKTKSEAETIQLGQELAGKLEPGTVIALYGDLGAGKTCLTRGICAGLDIGSGVSSPSFTLINEYIGKLPVYHFDFYRLEQEQAFYGLGLDDYFEGEGICIIEWAERAEKFLPQKRINIQLKANYLSGFENEREIEIRFIGYKS